MTASSGATTERSGPAGAGPDAVDETLRTAGGHAVAVLAEQGPDDRDVARARADEGVADHQAAAHVALGIGEAMGGAVGAEQARLGQGAGIAPVGLHLARAGRIHGREVRVGDDDLVAERLETAGHPFTVGRGLDHNPGAGPGAEHGGEALGLGADALLDDLAPLGEDVDLAFPLVHVDANMVHGWPPFSCGVDRVLSVGQSMPPRQAGGQPLHPIYALADGSADRLRCGGRRRDARGDRARHEPS